MPVDTEVRKARTESFFRDVNERIAESADRFGADTAEFVCECDDAGCSERVPASLEEYEDVRQDATHFLLVPGHDDEEIERVVTRRRRHAVVEKVNAVVARTVRQLNPRAETA